MDTLLAIVITVGTGLLILSITFFAKSWFMQPKLRIRVLSGQRNSRRGLLNDISLIWDEKLEICNLTDFPALNVSFIWPDPARQLPLPRLEPPHVSARETKVLDFQIIKEFPKEQVKRHSPYRHEKLLPEELRAFVLVLKYQNSKGISFYTRYERNGEEENCKYHCLKPKS